ncbi:unnamed protein product [Prorocentrum cordatum]|uniref:Amino acid transporter n=1 Tax=Prorocentrum cordatum TaxID=2364126 RepID=A0ABN9TVG2_9DINO|nr:unnamed protein product [Polarella glacialis]
MLSFVLILLVKVVLGLLMLIMFSTVLAVRLGGLRARLSPSAGSKILLLLLLVACLSALSATSFAKTVVQMAFEVPRSLSLPTATVPPIGVVDVLDYVLRFYRQGGLSVMHCAVGGS